MSLPDAHNRYQARHAVSGNASKASLFIGRPSDYLAIVRRTAHALLKVLVDDALWRDRVAVGEDLDAEAIAHKRREARRRVVLPVYPQIVFQDLRSEKRHQIGSMSSQDVHESTLPFHPAAMIEQMLHIIKGGQRKPACACLFLRQAEIPRHAGRQQQRTAVLLRRAGDVADRRCESPYTPYSLRRPISRAAAVRPLQLEEARSCYSRRRQQHSPSGWRTVAGGCAARLFGRRRQSVAGAVQ